VLVGTPFARGGENARMRIYTQEIIGTLIVVISWVVVLTALFLRRTRSKSRDRGAASP
jgi:hypothetical protein